VITSDEIIKFWFEEITPKQWWVKDASFDVEIGQRFGATLEAAAKGELVSWRKSAQGRLAEIIVLDQFSRNIYRDNIRAFSSDPIALVLAQEAIGLSLHRELAIEQKKFLFMPFMHSESLVIHEEALILFSEPGLEDNLDFERRHKAIIDDFGRYPHRNDILGRQSTEDEIEFLKKAGSSF